MKRETPKAGPSSDGGLSGKPIPQPPAIPDHELIRRIGGGSYGEVWLARSVMGTYRAVKIVSRASFEHDRPFEREFAGIKKFEPISRSHEGLVDLLQVGRNDTAGYFYYVMELADDVTVGQASSLPVLRASLPAGQDAKLEASPQAGRMPALHFNQETYSPRTLRSLLRPNSQPSTLNPQANARLPLDECIQLGLSLTNALAYLHGQGLVHRDIKPSNIIFVGGVPKLADVGLVTGVDEARSYVGTEGFIPPEGPGSPQADLYSLGILLYVMSTGKTHQDFPEPLPDLAAQPDHARWLEFNAVIHKACVGDVRERYQSAEAMHADFELLRVGKSVRRKRTLQQRWVVCKRAGLALVGFTALVVTAVILSRGIAPTDLYPDGPPSTMMEANMFCDKGMLTIRNDSYSDFPKAYTNFHRAIELDSRFARPYVGLLELLLRESNPNVKAAPNELRSTAVKLHDLAPHLAATAVAQSIISYYDWDYPAAKRSALQAIRANANYELAHTWYGFMLCMWGHTNESRAELEISQVLRPSKVTVYRCLGQTYYLQRDYTNAIAWERQALDLEPHHGGAFSYIGRAQRAMGDYSNAMLNFEKRDLYSGADVSEIGKAYGRLRQAFNEGGTNGYWREQWRQIEDKPDQDCYWKAVILIHLGDTNVALDWLEKSYDAHERSAGGLESPLSYVLFDEYWDGLHAHPRFIAILEKIGFTKVMPPPKK